MKQLLPEGWVRPKGYSAGIEVTAGRMVFVAGLVGWDENEQFVSDDLVDQFRQVLVNTCAVLQEAGGGPEHVVRMTWYVTNKQEYLSRLSEVGTTYRDVMGKNFPAMACVEVADLMEDSAKIEIETTAVIPA
ncbi:RidA family protein [Nitrincola sp. MINF-07-Sa-05]|uniref:RidA family protein n=1 Tax=Nitrincola salilacus TaxID=3400273 RepID=UPI00391823FF